MKKCPSIIMKILNTIHISSLSPAQRVPDLKFVIEFKRFRFALKKCYEIFIHKLKVI